VRTKFHEVENKGTKPTRKAAKKGKRVRGWVGGRGGSTARGWACLGRLTDRVCMQLAQHVVRTGVVVFVVPPTCFQNLLPASLQSSVQSLFQ